MPRRFRTHQVFSDHRDFLAEQWPNLGSLWLVSDEMKSLGRAIAEFVFLCEHLRRIDHDLKSAKQRTVRMPRLH